MKFDTDEIDQTSVLFIITNILSSKDIIVTSGELKEYQKHGFRLGVEFAHYIKNIRLHFYHFDQETMSDALLLDKIFSRLSNSIRELVKDEKIIIIIDKEQYDWVIDSTGDQFENKITACLPDADCPVKLDMASDKKQIETHQLHYFMPDGVDKQGGFVRQFAEVEFEGEPSDN